MTQLELPDRELGEALGRCLAALHAATAAVPVLTVANCGVVGFPDAPPEERRLGDDSAAGAAAIAAVCADEEFAKALRRAAAVLTPGCLVHGGVKWGNGISTAGPPPPTRVFGWG